MASYSGKSDDNNEPNTNLLLDFPTRSPPQPPPPPPQTRKPKLGSRSASWIGSLTSSQASFLAAGDDDGSLSSHDDAELEESLKRIMAHMEHDCDDNQKQQKQQQQQPRRRRSFDWALKMKEILETSESSTILAAELSSDKPPPAIPRRRSFGWGGGGGDDDDEREPLPQSRRQRKSRIMSSVLQNSFSSFAVEEAAPPPTATVVKEMISMENVGVVGGGISPLASPEMTQPKRTSGGGNVIVQNVPSEVEDGSSDDGDVYMEHIGKETYFNSEDDNSENISNESSSSSSSEEEEEEDDDLGEDYDPFDTTKPLDKSNDKTHIETYPTDSYYGKNQFGGKSSKKHIYLRKKVELQIGRNRAITGKRMDKQPRVDVIPAKVRNQEENDSENFEAEINNGAQMNVTFPVRRRRKKENNTTKNSSLGRIDAREKVNGTAINDYEETNNVEESDVSSYNSEVDDGRDGRRNINQNVRCESLINVDFPKNPSQRRLYHKSSSQGTSKSDPSSSKHSNTTGKSHLADFAGGGGNSNSEDDDDSISSDPFSTVLSSSRPKLSSERTSSSEIRGGSHYSRSSPSPPSSSGSSESLEHCCVDEVKDGTSEQQSSSLSLDPLNNPPPPPPNGGDSDNNNAIFDDAIKINTEDAPVTIMSAKINAALPPPTKAQPQSSSSSSGKPSRRARLSMSADSPYYTSYVDKEMRKLTVLTETLRDISARAKTFGKCGALMAEATRRLSLSCKLHPPNIATPKADTEEEIRQEKERQRVVIDERRESVGEEMESVLKVLGEVLDEVADAQVQMCESLEASLSLSLEAFAGVELKEASRLRSEAENMTDSAEAAFSKYLHGRYSPTANSAEEQLQNVATASWNKLSEQVGSQIGSSLKSWGRSGSDEAVQSGKGISSRGGRGSGKLSGEKDSAFSQAQAAANLRQNLEQIRLAQANAELKRFQLLRRLDSLKSRRNFELGESALASLNGIRAYFHHCSDLTQGLTPRLATLQTQQELSRKKHDAQQIPWESREKGLTNSIGEVGIAAANAGVIADAIRDGQGTGLGQSMIADQPTSLEEIEKEVKLWDLPRLLAESSLYRRDPTPGVVVEGWLYKKSSGRMSLNTWNKRWVVLDKGGVYYLKGGLLSDSSRGQNDSLERVKICDIVLCTVREVVEKSKGNSGALRFCFEIISPNNKPYMLQACGPQEFRVWVDGIRSAIEKQLSQGHVPPANILPPGKKSQQNSSLQNPFDEVGNSSFGSIGDEYEGGHNSFGNNRKSMEGSEAARQHMLQSGSTPFMRDDDDMTVQTTATSVAPTSRNPLVGRILDANPICADCGAASPDWASLNLGVLLCIECSGVHRSLGVHVSKVRSVRLDELSDAEARLLLALGNKKANSIWEAAIGVQTGWRKPKADDSRKLKQDWIKSKFLWKGFLEYSSDDGREHEDREEKFSKLLYEAARRGDVYAAAEALAKGGSVEWKNDAENGNTALHVCSMGAPAPGKTWLGIECAELLLQNGAKTDTLNDEQQSVLDCAVIGNGQREMIEYLAGRTI